MTQTTDMIGQSKRLAQRLVADEIPSFVHEKRYLTRTGEVVRANTTVTVVRNERRKALCTMAMIVKIDEPKLEEEPVD